MSSPLINRLVEQLDYPLLDQQSFDEFVQAQPFSLLFFTEEPKRFPESNDVAVILPELVKAFPQLSPAVIARDSEKALQARYNFSQWPTLVLLSRGRYLGQISRVQNWDEYIQQIDHILKLIPTRDPGQSAPTPAPDNAAPACNQGV